MNNVRAFLNAMIKTLADSIPIEKVTVKELCSAHDLASSVTIDNFLDAPSVKFNHNLEKHRKESMDKIRADVHSFWNQFNIACGNQSSYAKCMDSFRDVVMLHVKSYFPHQPEYFMTTKIAMIFIILYSQQL